MPRAVQQRKWASWQKWAWSVLFVDAGGAALVWALFPVCAAWFLVGCFPTIVVMAPVCLWLLDPPPQPGKRFRRIHCDPRQHPKKLRLWIERPREDPTWRQNPCLVAEFDLPFGACFEFDPHPGAPCFGIHAEV